MAQKLYEETNIQAIANAIREKNGESTTYKTSEMAAAIVAIPSGSGGDLPEEAYNLSGSFAYRFINRNWDWFIENYGNKVVTSGISDMNQAFSNSDVTKIPFTLNFVYDTNNRVAMQSAFRSCMKLTELPEIGTKVVVNNCENIFQDCRMLREIPESYSTNFDFSYIASLSQAYSGSMAYMFGGCYSLRKIPYGLIKRGNPEVSYSNSYFYSMCNGCYALDELVDLPLHTNLKSAWTSNAFGVTISNCHRLKRFTFEKKSDGSPKTVHWKNQTIDISGEIGWGGVITRITGYNSGITRDKQVVDDASYQALKNDPDWFTTALRYSRYNHDSAVETINSLPDASSYLANNGGGTNTLKLKGAAGSSTDGGAVNTLTQEEIAVATAKGWTVTLS